jgi:hypothetical protein
MAKKIPAHVANMGWLIVNLQSLEFALRAFLHNDEIGWQKSNQSSDFLENIKGGDTVPKNAFTNYDTLKDLIKTYNRKVLGHDASLCVDEELVSVRDALAHGRIASKSPSTSAPNKLVKYDRPKDGLVQVTHCVIMDKEWFEKQIHLAYQNIQKVKKANEILGTKQPQAMHEDG